MVKGQTARHEKTLINGRCRLYILAGVLTNRKQAEWITVESNSLADALEMNIKML